jgi:NAD(P)-dependent dehydrogenase (short-subunit alcohol dehydrogenase family)
MLLQGKHALVTGSSRGIGRAIASKLATQGAKVGINYRQNEEAAADSLAQIRASGSNGFVVQADVSRPEDMRRMFSRVQAEFGTLDIFVNNALGDLFAHYQSPMALTLDQWNLAIASQAQAFLLGVQEAARLMPDGGRIVAVTYAPGGRSGSWQPYVAQGTAKAAMDSLMRYFAVALAPQGITVNSISPGGVFGAPNLLEGSIFRALPQEVQDAIQAWHESGWTPILQAYTGLVFSSTKQDSVFL